jgi:hypothetical protein
MERARIHAVSHRSAKISPTCQPIFPNDRSLIRLAASVVIEQNDEWLVGRRYLSNHSMEALLTDYEQDNNRKDAAELAAA